MDEQQNTFINEFVNVMNNKTHSLTSLLVDEQQNAFINDCNNKTHSLTSLLVDEQQNVFINDCNNKTYSLTKAKNKTKANDEIYLNKDIR